MGWPIVQPKNTIHKLDFGHWLTGFPLCRNTLYKACFAVQFVHKQLRRNTLECIVSSVNAAAIQPHFSLNQQRSIKIGTTRGCYQTATNVNRSTQQMTAYNNWRPYGWGQHPCLANAIHGAVTFKGMTR